MQKKTFYRTPYKGVTTKTKPTKVGFACVARDFKPASF